jgi:hypothetical protein
MPSSAFVFHGRVRLSCFACYCWISELAAVRVVIQHMVGGSDFTSRGCFETKLVHNIELSDDVTHLSRFKPHDVVFRGCHVLFEQVFVERFKLKFIKTSWK